MAKETSQFQWYRINQDGLPGFGMYVAKVPGGWFIASTNQVEAIFGKHPWGTMMFYPDPEHKWNLATLPLR